MKNLFLFFVSSIYLIFISCGTSKEVVVTKQQLKFIKFNEKKPEVVLSETLKSFFNKTPNPRVVLRVPSENKSVTSEDINSNKYNIIEKELVKNGFIVRDRAIFNEVLSKTSENTDYSKLKGATETDLIIEIINHKKDVPFVTNKYQNENGESFIFANGKTVPATGTSIEFRIIMLSKNEFAGSVRIFSTPCSKGKGCLDPSSNFNYRSTNNNTSVGYEILNSEQEVDDAFYQESATKLIRILKGLDVITDGEEKSDDMLLDPNIKVEKIEYSSVSSYGNISRELFKEYFPLYTEIKLAKNARIQVSKFSKASVDYTEMINSLLNESGFETKFSDYSKEYFILEYYVGSIQKNGLDPNTVQILLKSSKTNSLICKISQRIKNYNNANKVKNVLTPIIRNL